LSLVGQFLKAFVAAPFSLRDSGHLQAVGVVDLRAGVATDHVSIFPANLTEVLILGRFFPLIIRWLIVFVRIL
jgi:hypothetical protein